MVEALLTLETPEADAEALRILERAALARSSFDPGLRRPLAIAYARNGQDGMAAVATAERLVLVGAISEAHRQAERAKAIVADGFAGLAARGRRAEYPPDEIDLRATPAASRPAEMMRPAARARALEYETTGDPTDGKL